uniref:Embryonic polyadenylate-binding protein 2 isoform X1 n=1 Tax=Camelus bactrianus TaxID=9837 RepID=A0A9W3FIJ6_CAMBA|nr:embryonic polyadenylate-binding protein 2 isoform X1 [Camelus bactrianus]
MWPFLSRALFPPPSEAWLRKASSDPEAQGWGAWSWTEKTPLGSGGGGGKEGKTGEVEGEDAEDAGILLSLLERADLAECPGPDQELEAIRLKLWAMEQAQGQEPPGEQGQEREEEGPGAGPVRQLLSPEPDTPAEKTEADHRSVYVGNVDYGGTAQELEAHFNHCGEIHRVTILCDKFSGHPKGYAYIEFATESSAQAAVELDKSVFRGRVIKGPGEAGTKRLRHRPRTHNCPSLTLLQSPVWVWPGCSSGEASFPNQTAPCRRKWLDRGTSHDHGCGWTVWA